jgi:hypothetical protein
MWRAMKNINIRNEHLNTLIFGNQQVTMSKSGDEFQASDHKTEKNYFTIVGQQFWPKKK